MESLLTKLAARRWFQRSLPIVLGLALLAAYSQPLRLDLWNDELYSLKHFQQVSLRSTVTDYHETNNHIFFNLLQNLCLRMMGSPATSEVLQRPELIRLLPLLFTLFTYAVLYRWMRRLSGIWAATAACLLLTATLPYYNFALQNRAYSLLMLLGMTYLYTSWQYLQDGRSARLALLAACPFCLFYAHPAGIYLLLAIPAGAAIAFSGSLMKHNRLRQRALYAASLTLLGTLAAGLAYLPVLDQLLANPWVRERHVDTAGFLKDKFLSSTLQLLCSRYWLMAAALAGALVCLRAARGGNRAAAFRLRWIIFCAAVYLLSFAIPMLRHDDAPQRTFTMLIPLIIGGAMPAVDALANGVRSGRFRRSILLAVTLILLVEIPLQIARRNREADRLAASGQENASLINAYYLHRFEPMRIARLAAAKAAESGLPVYCGLVYRQEMPHYLEALGVPWQEYRSPEQRAAAPDSFYVVTFFPEEFARQHAGEIECRSISTPPSFYHLLVVNRRQ